MWTTTFLRLGSSELPARLDEETEANVVLRPRTAVDLNLSFQSFYLCFRLSNLEIISVAMAHRRFSWLFEELPRGANDCSLALELVGERES